MAWSLRGSEVVTLGLEPYTTACEAWVKVTHEQPYFFEYIVPTCEHVVVEGILTRSLKPTVALADFSSRRNRVEQRNIGVCKLRNKVQVESTVILFTVKF